MLRKILPFVSLALFISLIVWSIHHTQQGQLRARYTVGYVTGWTQTLKNGRSIDYRCRIAGVSYRGSVHELPGMNSTPGACYIVAFDSTKPANNWAYYSNPVPDTAALPPPAGWSPHAYAHRLASWQLADSLQRAREGRRQDSLQLERYVREHARQ